MKYGKSKYKTIKYGTYFSVSDIRLVTFKPVSKVRIKSSSETYIAQTISIPMSRKIRINDTIAYTFTLNGCYNKIRVRSNSGQDYIITKVVSP